MSAKDQDQPLILFAMTVAQSLPFYYGQMNFLRKRGFRVGALSSPGKFEVKGVDFYPVEMSRAITPLKDLISLYRLVRLFRKIKPSIVNAGTPKAGLLCMIAAFLSRVPVRIYSSHGFRFETLHGLKRTITMMTEKLSVLFSTSVFCVSRSLQEKFISFKLARNDKTLLVHHGTCCGIDSRKFHSSEQVLAEAASIRQRFDIPAEAKVIGFTGRFIKAKGIQDLLDAFVDLQSHGDVYLLLVGDYEEEGDSVEQRYRELIAQHPRIKHTGFVTQVVPYFHSMDLFVLPSYREGFSTVLLEASAASLPVISTYATGCVDAVVEGETGWLVPAGDVFSLARAIEYALDHPDEAKAMGRRGRERVIRDYATEDVWAEHERAYLALLRSSIDKKIRAMVGENVRL